MSISANVNSLESIQDFKLALVKFAEIAKESIDSQKMELNRAAEWFGQQPVLWQQQTQQGWNTLSEARATLQRCQMNKVAGHQPTCQDEKKAVEKTKRFVQHAEDMVEASRLWAQKLQHEFHEYDGRLSRLDTNCRANIPHALATIDHLIASLEKYATSRMPSTADGPLTIDRSQQEPSDGNP
ncbi:MAG: hypothetical protein N2C12_03770 [Planctomycetales bacterium]